jgi:transposase-like protein
MRRIRRRQFTDDFKATAVTLAESIGPAKAARQLDISVNTLANWLPASRSRQPLSAFTYRLPGHPRDPRQLLRTQVTVKRPEELSGLRMFHTDGGGGFSLAPDRDVVAGMTLGS